MRRGLKKWPDVFNIVDNILEEVFKKNLFATDIPELCSAATQDNKMFFSDKSSAHSSAALTLESLKKG